MRFDCRSVLAVRLIIVKEGSLPAADMGVMVFGDLCRYCSSRIKHPPATRQRSA